MKSQQVEYTSSSRNPIYNEFLAMSNGKDYITKEDIQVAMKKSRTKFSAADMTKLFSLFGKNTNNTLNFESNFFFF